MFQDGLKEWITEPVVLAPREAILFFGRWLHKEGLPFGNERNIRFSLTGPVNWAGRMTQVEATVNTVQVGHQIIADAVMEKKTKARGTGHLQGLGKAIKSLAGVCKVDDWMQGLDEGASNGELQRTVDSHIQCIIGWGRWWQWQRAPRIPRGSPGGSPSPGGACSDRGSNQSSMCLTSTRASHNSHRSVHEGRGLWVKVNLPIFKDEKTKDAVTYCLWWWDVAIFCCLGGDNRHLLPYIFCSLQGFLCDIARSLGKDATLSNVLQMLDEPYGIIKMFNTLSKELYSLSKHQGRMWLKLGCACHSRSRNSSQSTWEGSCQCTQRRWSGIASMRALTPNTGRC